MRLFTSVEALGRLLLLMMGEGRLSAKSDSVRHGAQLFGLRDNALAIGRDARVNHTAVRYARAASTVRESSGYVAR